MWPLGVTQYAQAVEKEAEDVKKAEEDAKQEKAKLAADVIAGTVIRC